MMKNVTSSEITVCGHTYDEYIEMIKAFHGHVAPGMVIGGFMVDLANRNLPQGEYFDAICETRACLPDAIQLLTPCTVGNGWLRVVDLGRFALSLFEKYTGDGVRVYVNSRKLDDWPEIKAFFFKLTPKKEQDSEALIAEMNRAHTSILGVQKVTIDLNAIKSSRRDVFTTCWLCGEGYPENDGEICLGCQGKAPYSHFEILSSGED
ncbi:MAG: formylmethanofuran dehydrogenase subunit E family protein [Dehalococcoidales bacterium]|nr:MAG: formylmethanofuran dehydrogenase subunit E family protein [Dehalococcoidales bacterium]